jgi:hypothetical protein
MDLVCPIPGLGGPGDPTLLVHHVTHLALAAFVTVTGAGFLAQAIRAFRRSAPAREVPVRS